MSSDNLKLKLESNRDSNLENGYREMKVDGSGPSALQLVHAAGGRGKEKKIGTLDPRQRLGYGLLYAFLFSLLAATIVAHLIKRDEVKNTEETAENLAHLEAMLTYFWIGYGVEIGLLFFLTLDVFVFKKLATLFGMCNCDKRKQNRIKGQPDMVDPFVRGGQRSHADSKHDPDSDWSEADVQERIRRRAGSRASLTDVESAVSDDSDLDPRGAQRRKQRPLKRGAQRERGRLPTMEEKDRINDELEARQRRDRVGNDGKVDDGLGFDNLSDPGDPMVARGRRRRGRPGGRRAAVRATTLTMDHEVRDGASMQLQQRTLRGSNQYNMNRVPAGNTAGNRLSIEQDFLQTESRRRGRFWLQGAASTTGTADTNKRRDRAYSAF